MRDGATEGFRRIGFVGLGVMGEPICRNILRKSGLPTAVLDLRAEPVARLVADGATAAGSLAAIAEADLVLLSLPGGPEVERVCLGPGGLADLLKPGATLVDTSTAPAALARRIAERLAGRGAAFADAPVARTRQAAIDGTLSIMVGADAATFARLRPILAHAAADVTHCGPVGAGQVVKILNNMVVFQTVNALAEALAIGRRSGVEGRVLYETLAKGSADSFVLRNHGMKAMLPGDFPTEAFSTEYALKDLSYALELAHEAGVEAQGAALVGRVLEASREKGNGKAYFPALLRVVDPGPA